MSSSFTLHPSANAAYGDARALEGAELVRDGFSWAACLVPALWFAWHRHWLTALFGLLVVAGLGVGLWALGARPGTIAAAEILLHLLFGLEGASLRRFALERRGRPATDVVVASDTAEAEAKSFARWLSPNPDAASRPSRIPSAVGSASIRSRPEPVIGLFPDAEGRR